MDLSSPDLHTLLLMPPHSSFLCCPDVQEFCLLPSMTPGIPLLVQGIPHEHGWIQCLDSDPNVAKEMGCHWMTSTPLCKSC